MLLAVAKSDSYAYNENSYYMILLYRVIKTLFMTKNKKNLMNNPKVGL